MLPLSDNKITFNTSSDYLKFAGLFEMLALFILWQSALLLSVKCVFSLILLHVVFFIFLTAKPQTKYLQLSYRGGLWWLLDIDGQEHKYQKAVITFNGGLFFLLVLEGECPKLTIVVFRDQITKAQYRLIKHVSLGAK